MSDEWQLFGVVVVAIAIGVGLWQTGYADDVWEATIGNAIDDAVIEDPVKEQGAEDTLNGFTDAVDSEDWGAACRFVSSDAIDELIGTEPPRNARDASCELLLAVAFKDADLGSGSNVVRDSEQQGDNFVVTLTDGTEVVLTGDARQIDSFEPPSG